MEIIKAEERKRVMTNSECISLIHKKEEDITLEERDFIRDEFSGFGSVFGKAIGLAQFYTPDEVTRFIANYLNEKLPPDAKVLEPACGVGGLIKHLRSDVKATCVEVDDISAKISRICYPQHEVINDSAVNFKRSNYFDAVISNPPFNIPITGDTEWDCTKFDKKLGKHKVNSDIFFLNQAVDSLKVGGYGIFILPSGIGYKSTLKKTREYLLDNCWIIANIELGADTFAESGTTIKTHILIFRKAPKLPKYECNSYDKIEGRKFLLGQPPIICIQINEVEDQLEEALERLTDNLWLDNECPYNPTHTETDRCLYWTEHDEGYRVNFKKNYPKELVYFQNQTLGRGCEIEYEGIEYSTLDWEVMDELVEKYGRN